MNPLIPEPMPSLEQDDPRAHLLSALAQPVSSDPSDRFLIIEDNRADQVLLRVFFRRFSVRDEQLTFAAALSELKAGPYKAILCDLNIRDSEHLETLKAVRARYPHTPVVVMTGKSIQGLGLRALELGAQDYLIKGQFNDSEFFKTIQFAIQRHSLQRDLLLTRDEYEELFDTNPQPSIVYELETLAILKVNKRFCDVYGYSPEEATQLTLHDIRAEADHGRFQEDLRKLRETGLVDLSAVSHRKKSGEIMIMEVSSQCLLHSGSELAIATMNDISYKAAIENSLLLSHERFEHATRATRDVIYDWNLTKNELLWGESLNEQFGYETNPGNFNIHAWTKNVHPDDRQTFVDHLDDVLSGANLAPTHDLEYRLRRSDGSYASVTDRSIVVRTDEGKGLRIIGAIEDISARKESELKLEDAIHRLHQYNAKYEELFAEVPAFICYLKGRDHVFQLANPEFERVSGKRNLIGLPLAEAIPEFIEQDIIGQLDTVYRTGEPVSGKELPVSFVDESGAKRQAFVNFLYQPSHDARGEVDGMYVFGVDVTDQVLYRKRVEESAEERRRILNSITDIFFALDRNWTITYWNKAAEEKFNMSKQDVLGKTFFDLNKHIRKGGLYGALERAMESPDARLFDVYCGSLNLWLEGAAYPKEEGLSVYLKDVSHEKAFENELQEIRDNLTALINSTDDLIWSVDRQGILISANRPFLNRIRELSGMQILEGDSLNLEVFGKGVLMKWISHYNRAFTGERFSIHEEETTERGLRYSMYTFNPILDEAGQISGVACYARDVTERTRHLKAIEEQNRQFREISWLQSHAVRAPLARILGLIDLLKHDKDPAVSQKQLIDFLVQSAIELDGVITEISTKTELMTLSKNE
jgi:PAS domain S-box-containing protein